MSERCECEGWAGRMQDWAIAGHHRNCPHYDPIKGALRIIGQLVDGISSWASDEDGVHHDVWAVYCEALALLGRKLSDEQATGLCESFPDPFADAFAAGHAAGMADGLVLGAEGDLMALLDEAQP